MSKPFHTVSVNDRDIVHLVFTSRFQERAGIERVSSPPKHQEQMIYNQPRAETRCIGHTYKDKDDKNIKFRFLNGIKLDIN